MRGAAFAFALILAACSPPPADEAAAPEVAPAATQERVLSPEGYGPALIGMTVEEASAALGTTLTPDGALDEDAAACHTRHMEGGTPREGLTFMFEQGRLTRVSDYAGEALSPAAHTAEGVGVGSTDAQIRAAYPAAIEEGAKYADPPAHDLVVWTVPDQQGLRFELNAAGIAWALHAGSDSISYMEGCA